MSAVDALNASRGYHFKLDVTNIDILRGGAAHDLLTKAMQKDVLDRITAGLYDLVLLAPPCNTFSRALHSDTAYPQPMRDFVHPFGRPGLGEQEKANIYAADALVAFSARAVMCAGQAGCLAWLEFPEDLGQCRHGVPASVWQLDSFRELGDFGFHRGAVYQCEWSAVDFKKPTGFLTNVPALIADPDFYEGWPTFTDHDTDGQNRKYIGPLPADCVHRGQHEKLIGKRPDGEFKTSASAAYHADFCRRLAGHFVQELCERSCAQIGHSTPSGGGKGMATEVSQQVPLYMPVDLTATEIAAVSNAVSGALPASGAAPWGLHATRAEFQESTVETFEIRGDWPAIRRINEVVREVSLRAGRPFRWTSLQLVRDMPSRWHVDDGIDESMLLVVGDFEGGEFRSEGRVDLNVAEKAVFIKPGTPHMATPHTGSRISVVAYRHPSFENVVGEQGRLLVDLGFQVGLGDLPGVIPPSRIEISRECMSDPDTVYIGRGHAGLGLGRSLWANPFAISAGNPRKKVIKDFKFYLGRTPALLEQLGALSGKRLACHCPADLPCHGDVLIEFFRDKFCTASADPPADRTVDAHRRTRALEAEGNGHQKIGRAPVAPSLQAGIGDPLLVQKGKEQRLMIDGGGLCSKGLWPPDRRGAVQALGTMVREQLRLALAENGADAKGVLASIVDADFSGDPFPVQAIEDARAAVQGLVSERLAAWRPAGEVLAQNVDVRLMGVLLDAFGDPDWEVLKQYEMGVRIGVGVRLPRTPLVFPEKVRWNVPGQERADVDDGYGFRGSRRDNYASAVEHRDEVRRVLEDQASRGQVEIVSERIAKQRFGDRLAIASLAAIVKGTREDGSTEVRIVHDGTNGVGVNGSIKVLDYVALPAATDVQRAMRYCQESAIPYYAFTADISEAHRQVKVHPDDAGYQACQLEQGGPVYLNLVGTYGVASASYWWGRLGAAALRLLHHVLGDDLRLWIFLFADDWLLLSGGRAWIEGGVFALMLLRVLGFPIAWRKVSAGFVVSWIGLEVNLREWSLGLSARRAAWVCGWLGRVLRVGRIEISELAQAVGRMQFAYGVLVWDRPFLAPLYTLMALYPTDATVELPGFVKAAMHWLKSRLEARRSIPCGRLILQSEALFRVDAKADGNDVAIGGWMPFRGEEGVIVKERSLWFAARVTPANAPWAFDKGEPFKTISALELLATVVALVLFRPAAPPGTRLQSLVSVSAHTDSMVASHVLGRSLTTAFPLCLVAMEAAAQMERGGTDLSLAWVPREVNSEADALSNFRFAGFSPECRVECDLASLPFLVLRGLHADAAEFYGHARVLKASARGSKRRRPTRPEERLRARDPW